MGCGASSIRSLFTPDEETALAALRGFDEKLRAAVAAGHIRVLRVTWLLKQPKSWRVLRRQDLEMLEAAGERPFLSAEEAVALIDSGSRALGVLSYGWLQPGSPDPNGEHLRIVRRFLTTMSKSGTRLRGLFGDYCALPQHGSQRRRSESEDLIFSSGLDAMSDLYASAVGTTVLVDSWIPPRPDGFEGEYNDRPISKRGWCIFEVAVSCELIARLEHDEAMKRALAKLPSAKVYEISKPDQDAVELTHAAIFEESEIFGLARAKGGCTGRHVGSGAAGRTVREGAAVHRGVDVHGGRVDRQRARHQDFRGVQPDARYGAAEGARRQPARAAKETSAIARSSVCAAEIAAATAELAEASKAAGDEEGGSPIVARQLTQKASIKERATSLLLPLRRRSSSGQGNAPEDEGAAPPGKLRHSN